MKILGIYDGHNANAALSINGKIYRAVEEERFSRIKNHDGRWDSNTPPIRSVKYCLENIDSIDAIAIALEEPEELSYKAYKSFFKDIENPKRKKRVKFLSEQNNELRNRFSNIPSGLFHSFPGITQQNRVNKIKTMLNELKLGHVPIYFIKHHIAHHASSYYTSGKEKGISFALDGRGDDLSGMICLCNGGKIEVIYEQNYLDSIGHFYSAVTVSLGFKSTRHEGKITGLAAYGNVNKELLKKFNTLFEVNEHGAIISKMADDVLVGPYPHTNFTAYVDKIKPMVSDYSKEDVAATAQYLLEYIVCLWIDFWLKKTGETNIFLCGGVFANVKLNQKVYELNNVEYIYVHPGMTDSGMGLGASLQVYNNIRASMKLDYEIEEYHHMYFGPSFSDDDILNALKVSGLKYYRSENLEKEVSIFLAQGNVVARFEGGMEYGPRALGHRSILCSAQDKKVNEWLNKKFSRTEFMPFAPATLYELADIYYINKTKKDYYHTAKFMTIACDCTDLMQKHSPAVVHIDNTARPQLVCKEDSPSYYSIIKNYYELTGIGSIINTSFNMHEDPIVCTPQEAIKSFKDSQLDILAIGNYIAKMK